MQHDRICPADNNIMGYHDVEFPTPDGGSPIFYREWRCDKCGYEERGEAWSATD